MLSRSVKGLAWTDERLGAGRAIDETIARHLAGVYAEQLTAKGGGIDGEAVSADVVWSDPRVAMMLLQEGAKCKEVLSANTERQIVVEGLPTPDGGLEGSLRTQLSREQLENLSAQVIDGWVDVVTKALAQVCMGASVCSARLRFPSPRTIASSSAVQIRPLHAHHSICQLGHCAFECCRVGWRIGLTR